MVGHERAPDPPTPEQQQNLERRRWEEWRRKEQERVARAMFDAGRMLRSDVFSGDYSYLGSSTPEGSWRTLDEAFKAAYLTAQGADDA